MQEHLVTPEEARNLDAVQRWESFYNAEPDRMVDEVYAPEFIARSMRDQREVRTREELRAYEHAMSAAYPDRRLTVVNRIASGDTVVVEVAWEGTYEGPDHPHDKMTINMCMVLTFRDGFIVNDHTYAPTTNDTRPQVVAASVAAANVESHPEG